MPGKGEDNDAGDERSERAGGHDDDGRFERVMIAAVVGGHCQRATGTYADAKEDLRKFDGIESKVVCLLLDQRH